MSIDQNGSAESPKLIAKSANGSHSVSDAAERASDSVERLRSIYPAHAPKNEPKPANDGAVLRKTAASARSSEGDLVACAGVKLKGEISSCDTLMVEGEVEAQLRSRQIVVATGGVFIGRAEVGQAEIAGRFNGTLAVTGKLVIRSTGCVQGQVSYGQLEIEPGGELRGRVAVQASTAKKPTVLRKSSERSWSWKS